MRAAADKKNAMNKKKLDERVAVLTGRSVEEVAAITSTFLRLVAVDLLRGERVWLPGFGTFYMRGAVGELRVRFRRSFLFRRLLQVQMESIGGTVMEKYAVDENQENQEELEKKAAQGCPECGGKIERHGSTLICVNCGSAPFEAKKK